MVKELPKWPKWMRCALASGFEVQVDEMRVKSDTDAGSLIRVDFPNVDKCTATGELLLDSLQSNFFETFERDILVQGSKWFLFPLWVSGQVIDHTVRMKERLSWGQKEGEYTHYSFTLEVGQREGLMPAWLAEIFLWIDLEFLLWFNDYLYHALHVEPGPKITVLPKNIWTATGQEWEAAK